MQNSIPVNIPLKTSALPPLQNITSPSVGTSTLLNSNQTAPSNDTIALPTSNVDPLEDAKSETQDG